jgi:hypothetical protein
VRESFLGHPPVDLRNVVGQLLCHIIDSPNEFIRIDPQFFGLSAPVTELDTTEAIFPAGFPGEFHALRIDLAVGEYTCQIVQARLDECIRCS